jgi:hypothetical protein
MDAKAERRKARERVATYHEACLQDLVEHVGRALDSYRAGEIDAFGMDESIHQYHRAAKELWKFCWASGSATQLEFVAEMVDRQALEGRATDWWHCGTRQR